MRYVALEIRGREFLEFKFRQILLVLRGHLNRANYLLMLIGFWRGKILFKEKGIYIFLRKSNIFDFYQFF